MKAYYMKFMDLNVFENMALDEYLYIHIEEPIFRFYVFKEPSITIGYNQRYIRSCNTEFVENENIPITRRITGGRTVLHSGDLTYSFSSTYNAFKNILINNSNNLTKRYRLLSDAFVHGFKYAGIDVEVNSNKTDTPYTENCFSSTSLYEITLNGEKILGSAQTFLKDRFMQQGTILVNNYSENLDNVFSAKMHISNIENINKIVYNIKVLSENFYKSFFNFLSYDWEELSFKLDNAEYRKMVDKYCDEQWVKRR